MEKLCWLRGSLVAVTIGILVETTVAAPPWQRLVTPRRDRGSSDLPYELTEKQGPWLILAASFAGEAAEKDARELVKELRSVYKLKAYLYSERYDFRDSVVGRGINQDREPKKMRYYRNIAFDEVAVLVGDFPSVDDPSLQKTLKLIEHAQPRCLQLDKSKETTLRFAGLRAFHRRLSGDEEKQQKGPMGSAFVSRNPLLPKEYFVPQGVDELVMSMNKGVEHSLLDCPSRYSVRVATFRGNRIIDQRKIQEISEGTSRMKSQLAKAAEDAHKLTMALREQKVEAYEFHDRHESIVTVGSFQTIGTTLPNGTTDLHPAIARIIEAYGPERKALPGATGGAALTGLRPRTLSGIPFDVQPIPVQVPRRSIAADYARSRSPLR